MNDFRFVRLQFWYRDNSWALYIMAGLLIFLVLWILALPVKSAGYISGIVEKQYYLESDTQSVKVKASVILANGKIIMLPLNNRNDASAGQEVCLSVLKSVFRNLGYELALPKKCTS